MIDLYFWTTDNGYKARTAMEESGLPHKLIPINIRNREQFAPEYLKISPGHKIPALVDHDGPGFHHVGRDELRPPDGGDQHVGEARDGMQIPRRGMADGYRAVRAGPLLQGEERDGFAHDEGAAEHDHMLPFEVNAAAGAALVGCFTAVVLR